MLAQPWRGQWQTVPVPLSHLHNYASPAAEVMRLSSKDSPLPMSSSSVVLSRRHAQRAVQSDHLAVQHLVLDDVLGERAVLGGAAEA
jgi:hypothetical protein